MEGRKGPKKGSRTEEKSGKFKTGLCHFAHLKLARRERVRGSRQGPEEVSREKRKTLMNTSGRLSQKTEGGELEDQA